jgi:hypothetical protein
VLSANQVKGGLVLDPTIHSAILSVTRPDVNLDGLLTDGITENRLFPSLNSMKAARQVIG